MLRLGVVSFLNSRPLIYGLTERADVECVFDVPAVLPGRLERGEVDVALVPIVDLLRNPDRYEVVSDACIACDGETMTVRVFSQLPPDRITQLWVDPDSHTSVLLAQVLWHELYNRELELLPLERTSPTPAAAEAVLLIGDKVVSPSRGRFAYEVDLGGAWRQHTGLPFVFAVWARVAQPAPAESPPSATPSRSDAATLLSHARDAGVAVVDEIAAADGPTLGWPVAAARRYLARCLCYQLNDRALAGANIFAEMCVRLGLLPEQAAIRWPDELLPTPTGAQE